MSRLCSRFRKVDISFMLTKEMFDFFSIIHNTSHFGGKKIELICLQI